MSKRSAGLLVYRLKENATEVFLVHPGGPFWKNKDEGAWSIPKGEYGEDEDPLEAARREFTEETGFGISGNFRKLSPVKQKGGKEILAWAVEADFDSENIISNTFEMEWPPRSGKMQAFPEIDRAGWFSIVEARGKINPGQLGLLEELKEISKS